MRGEGLPSHGGGECATGAKRKEDGGAARPRALTVACVELAWMFLWC